MKRFTLLFLILLLAITGPAAAQEDEGLLSVDAGQVIGPINPHVYGANYGTWAGIAFDMRPAAVQSGITLLRFPGGEWGDRNNIRPQMIEDFVLLLNEMGAEGLIHVRLQNGTPEQAAELVRYTNIEKGHGIRYWSIGNEPGLYPDYSMEQHNAEWRAIAEAMLAVDPDIILIGPDVHQFPPDLSSESHHNIQYEWVRQFLLANGDLVDMVAIHRYPFPRGMTSGQATPEQLRDDPQTWDSIIDLLRDLIRETTGGDMPIAITEFNSHWGTLSGGTTTPDSLYSAIWLSDVLGRIIKKQVDMATVWLLYTPNTFGGSGLLSRFDPRPPYYVYLMYRGFGSELVYSATDDEHVTIYAALRDDGTLTLMVINLGDDETTRRLSLEGFTPGADAEVWRFDSEHNAEQLDSIALADGALLSLPGWSVTLYVIPAG